MCDQDHFEDDRLEYEAGGMVTRRQFGVLVAAGVALALPKVVNAVAVTEMDVTIKTPDGTCDAYFVHPATGTAPGVLVWPDIFGLRPAFRQMGKRLAETGYSVLVVNPFYRTQKAPTAAKGAATPIPGAAAACKDVERDHAHDRREGVHRVARSAAVGCEEPQDRERRGIAWAGRWRSARRRPSRSRRRGRLVPRRRTGDQGRRTARICRRRRPRRRCSSRSRRTTTCERPMRRTC